MGFVFDIQYSFGGADPGPSTCADGSTTQLTSRLAIPMRMDGPAAMAPIQAVEMLLDAGMRRSVGIGGQSAGSMCSSIAPVAR